LLLNTDASTLDILIEIQNHQSHYKHISDEKYKKAPFLHGKR